MSLDVTLSTPAVPKKCYCRDCGDEHETQYSERLYSSNITHNLNKMAEAAGIYQALWRPEEEGYTHARQLIEPLTIGLDRLISTPEKYEAFNASNGWGLYKHFVPFVEEYLNACKQYPDALVHASR